MAKCPTLTPQQEFLAGFIQAIDCHSSTIGSAGYSFLANSNSPLMAIISGTISIFVAIFGYRMILGNSPNLRETVVSVVKIGLVLALATNWSTYRTLVYDVAMHGPTNLASQLANSSEITDSKDKLESRLQSIDGAILDFAYWGPGNLPLNKVRNPNQKSQDDAFLTPAAGFWDPLNEENSILKARSIFLAGTLSALTITKIVAGIFLAVGPFFICFLLFERTRGLFVGWLRVIIAASLGAFSTAFLLKVEVAVLQPWLNEINDKRKALQDVSSAPTELLVIVISFVILAYICLLASAFLAAALKWPQLIHTESREEFNSKSATFFEAVRFGKMRSSTGISANVENGKLLPERAPLVGESLERSDRRLKLLNDSLGYQSNETTFSGKGKEATYREGNYSTKLGQQGIRRTSINSTLSSKRRERLA